MGLLKERLYILGTRMVFFCVVEGADGCFEVFSIKLALCLSDETRERVGIQGESFGTVGSRFLLVDLGLALEQISTNFAMQKFIPLCSTRKPSQRDCYITHSENVYVCSQPP